MASEFSAGLTRSDIAFIMQHDAEVISMEEIDGAAALWRISVSVEGGSPVEMLIDNGINELYVQALVQCDSNFIYEALSATEAIAVVGLTVISDQLFMRGALFIEHSTMHAFTNTYRAAAIAHNRYLGLVASSSIDR
jgi:hypothetical protein